MVKTKALPKPKAKSKKLKFNKVGFHVIADFWGAKNVPDTEKEIEEMLIEAAKRAKGTVLKTSLYKFEPQGVTGVVLLSESHISIHTWPERGYCSIDAYTCGNHTKPAEAIKYMKSLMKPSQVQLWKINRGELK